MSAAYLGTALMGYSDSHLWSRWLISSHPHHWFVSGTVGFTHSGFAVIDDFGVLVEVPT